jgi:hypothetical protein
MRYMPFQPGFSPHSIVTVWLDRRISRWTIEILCSRIARNDQTEKLKTYRFHGQSDDQRREQTVNGENIPGFPLPFLMPKT